MIAHGLQVTTISGSGYSASAHGDEIGWDVEGANVVYEDESE